MGRETVNSQGQILPNKIIKQFPILRKPENGKRLVYLDNAATTQLPASVLDAMREYYENDNANPHRGVYNLASRATARHEGARRGVAEFIRADPAEVIFTQNTTESLNLVVASLSAYVKGLGLRDFEVAVYLAEHHSNLLPWQRFAKETGAKLTYLYPGRNGVLTETEIRRKITARTGIVAIAEVSNVLGLRTPMELIKQQIQEVGFSGFPVTDRALLILDAAQAVAHLPITLDDVDFLAFSGHKVYGPAGVGVLYGRKELLEALPPVSLGGAMVLEASEDGFTPKDPPQKFEAGTRNVAAEVGLTRALDLVPETHAAELAGLLAHKLNILPFIELYGDVNKPHYGIVSFNVKGWHPHDVATLLDDEGITLRAGHHCAEPLLKYLARFHPELSKHASCLRASFGVYNTVEDVEALVEALKKIAKM